jgi:hypothetical protein
MSNGDVCGGGWEEWDPAKEHAIPRNGYNGVAVMEDTAFGAVDHQHEQDGYGKEQHDPFGAAEQPAEQHAERDEGQATWHEPQAAFAHDEHDEPTPLHQEPTQEQLTHGMGEQDLPDIQSAFAEMKAYLDEVYHQLRHRAAELQRRETEVAAREQRAHEQFEAAERTHDEAQRRASEVLEDAEQQRTRTISLAEVEAGRIVERSRNVDAQLSQRLTEVTRREQELRSLEDSLAQTAQQQQSEREWLNQYAQTLNGIAADLERAVGGLQPAR